MTRTPDEIKQGRLCCSPESCNGDRCPYREYAPRYEGGRHTCRMLLWCDTSDYIQQLEAQNAELLTKVEQLQAERDAAVRDCGCFPCQTCEERENGDLCPMCEINGGFRKFHQWRGVQKEG